ncbi:molybdopterin-dependent oxidoreductase [Nocardia sp. 348MFTsu5.1]|uniref:molybdopterin-dependent oxidoreductase n=1 Tax=Nocardia sp. 348MFTsu5.1 TaxID=1172185 RepID=UPI000364475C|nr:molybdopterin-dependent oxidoreductase [Nocardia sp. 348MFTsu5.1]
MADSIEYRPTFCRICEPLCGMIATVEDGRLTALRPDRDHPLSTGFACQKGIAFTEVQNDPDRVTVPLRKTGDGGFEEVSWEEAMTDIAARLSRIVRREGSGAVGWYFGNPGAFSYSHLMWAGIFIKGLGRHTHFFTAASQDVGNRMVASQLLYGTPTALPIPDVLRTELLVVIGANPVVSHGSVLTLPRIKDRISDVVKRGGRVVVIDPRKTETASAFEWLGIRPDGDAYLLLSVLQVLFDEGLVACDAIRRQADGLEWLQLRCASFTPEATSARTGVEPEVVRALARDLARASSAAVYGRFGTSTGQSGTLTTYLIDAVNIVTGNLDSAGGTLFGDLGIPGQRWSMKLTGAYLRRAYRTKRSRVGGFPRVIGAEPATLMAKEITTPGRRQIRALFVSAGNPVLSVPNGDELESAAAELELMVGLDLYVTETTAHCDYILPVTTMYERDDFPVTFQTQQTTPFRQATEAVVDPVGDVRQEWEIIDDLMQRMDPRPPVFAVLSGVRKLLGWCGVEFTPRTLIDGIIRMSAGGDRFGMRRGGLTFRRLTADYPHGKVLEQFLPSGIAKTVVVYRGGRVHLEHASIATEIQKLSKRTAPEGFPLLMIGRREPRSENSWMHNSELLMRGERSHQALMNIRDAAVLDIFDGDRIGVTSPYGTIEIGVRTTEDIMAGVIAIPHGWGHRGTGGWQVANRAGGANVNRLTSSSPEDIEAISGMAWLTGVPVRVELL